jgi:alpha-amylase
MGHDSWHVSVRRRIIALFVALATLLAGGTIAATATTTASAATTSTRDSYSSTVGNSTFEAARNKYGLAKEMRDGATLHAFEWSFKTIEENIPDIAAAGYTSVQTEPIQKIKDNRKLGTGNWYLNWYYIYQPVDMSIGNYVVGSEDDFKELCDVAHKYGVRIIVDVVANHFTSDFDVIADRWRNKSYFHEDKQISDYNNREDCTQHKLSGLWDLNTQDATVTQSMADLLKQMVADGADGFRYDAAKHIELSDEVFGGKASNYWNTILQNGTQYQYGEVLEDANVRETDYADLFWNSSTGKGGITDSSFGHEVRNGVQHGSLSASHFTQHNKVTEDKTVNWVESHDNFANGEANIPQELNDEWIKYGWAGITAQKNGMTLFFDRPYKDGGTYGTGKAGTYGNGSGPFNENSKLGDAGSDLWKDPEVVAVNHFRNSMVGEDSNVSNCGDDLCLMVERSAGSSAQDGVVVANANSSEKSLAGTSTKLSNGTYTDEVTGSKLVVSGGTITSGSVKAKGIAAFSNKTRSAIISTAEAYPNKGTIPGTSKTITLRAYQATNTTYTTSDGQSGSYVDGDTVKIGANAKKGDVLTVTVTGTGANGETITHTYSYTKQGDPTYDPSDGTQSPCDKYCVAYMEKMGYNPDTYIDSQETDYEGGSGVDATGVTISGDGVSNGAVTRDISNGSTTLKLTAAVTPAEASQRVTWSSSDVSVASVASDGTVTFKKAGTATITAKANSGSASASITATVTGEAPKATNVIYATMPSGWSGTLYAYVYSGSGTAKNAAWPGVAMTKVDSSDDCANAGTYKYEVPDSLASSAKVIFTNGSSQYPGSGADGMAYTGGTVSWTSGQTSLTTATCSGGTGGGGTTVVAVSSVSVSPSSVSLQVGGSRQLSATVSPSNATDRTVSWSSSDVSVASVSSSGVVKALKAGSATVTAKAGGRSASASVVVKAAGSVTVPVSMVSVSGSKTVSVGSSVRLSATVSPANATNKTVVWGSLDPSVATVGADGTVTGVKAGSTRVVATAGNVSAAFDVSVSAVSSMTVWYRPASSSTKAVRLWYSPASGSSAYVDMVRGCDGYYSASVPVSGSSVKLVAQLDPSSGWKLDSRGSSPGWVVSVAPAVTLAYNTVYKAAHSTTCKTN